ncbi:NUDIX hydrolase [Variovorax sp. J22R133]|uniref:NUDIX hydrolase n=1 Tax=Variovorax brevis TaxID=3053503 RepID=UPI002574F2F0|nr:NUDIX hydrolase [Variovorax sp. J22R133]MDM0111322.1 NUDIX hydrolase [Variovorax sp. J22R133]
MTRVTSCGIVILNTGQQVLVCHATGTGRWDLPKGMQEAGESARATAVREAWEETSLDLDSHELAELGLFDYLPQKRLHLFGLKVGAGAIDIDACRCHSTFPDRITGQEVPEVDGYAWKPVMRLEEWCGKNLTRVFKSIDWARFQGLPEVKTVAVKP